MSTCINIGNATAKGTNLNADGANMHEYIVAGFADMTYVCGQGHVSYACNFVHILYTWAETPCMCRDVLYKNEHIIQL